MWVFFGLFWYNNVGGIYSKNKNWAIFYFFLLINNNDCSPERLHAAGIKTSCQKYVLLYLEKHHLNYFNSCFPKIKTNPGKISA